MPARAYGPGGARTGPAGREGGGMSGRRPCMLFFFDDCRAGESQRALLAALANLDRGRFPFRVLLPSYDGDVPALLREMGVEFDAIALPEALREDLAGVPRGLDG